MGAKAEIDFQLRDFLGRVITVPSLVLYCGHYGEMVLGRLVEVSISERFGLQPKVRMWVIPIKRSIGPDGYCAERHRPVLITNWRNLVCVSSEAL